MELSRIIAETDGKLLKIIINRPQMLNAADCETLVEIENTLISIDKKAIRAVIITGAGEKAFSAGADISGMADMSEAQAKEFSLLGHRVTSLIEEFPLPVIAAINGYAFGGGFEIALACDMRIASETAKIGLPEINLGVICGWGGTQRLKALAGKAAAAEFIMMGEIINTDKALQMGLVNYVVKPPELMESALGLAGKLASKPAYALSAIKQCLNVPSGFECEPRYFAGCFNTYDQKEGMRAFLEKRKPVFKDMPLWESDKKRKEKKGIVEANVST